MKNTLVILVIFNCLFTVFLIFERTDRKNEIEQLKIENLKQDSVSVSEILTIVKQQEQQQRQILELAKQESRTLDIIGEINKQLY